MARLLFTLLFLTSTALLARADAPPASLIANGGFETDANKDDWPDHWAKPKTGVRWGEENGNRFLRITSTEPGTLVLFYHSVKVPADAEALRLSWKQRVVDLVPGKQAWFDARILLDFKDDKGAKLKPAPGAPSTRKSTEGWVERQTEFLVPKGSRTLDIMPCLFQVEKGTFDLDDIALTAVDGKALREAAKAKEVKQAKAVEDRRAKAAVALEKNGSLIPNGHFELDAKKDGWPDGWGKPKTGVRWEAEGDNHFLRLIATEPGASVMLYQLYDLPGDVKALELTWKQRITGLKTGKFPWFDARIMIEFKDAAGQTLSGKPGAPYGQRDTKGWVERSAKFLVPAEALTIVLMPSLFQVEKGTLDLDDFVLKPVDAAALIAAAAAAEEMRKKAVVPVEEPNKAKWPSELRVEGRRVLDKAGKEVWLQGVNAGGLETLPHDRQVIKSTVVGVEDWKANIIRLPVKDDLWFGRSVYQKDGGKAYREMIDQIVTLCANRGAYLLLDLHRFRAPKKEHVEFWKDAAERYKNHPAVLFDIFNEPHGISWEIWRDGGFVSERKTKADEDAFQTEEEKAKAKQGFDSPGMQALVDAIRGTGAKNIVVAGGLSWAADLSGIAKGTVLTDKTGNGIVYAWHIYNWHNDWEGKVMAAAEKYPILVGELGADAKKLDFIPAADQEDPYTWVPDMLGFIQKHRLHWTGWCLHPAASPVMISDWNYTPTPYWGEFAKRALAGEKFEMKKMR